MINVSTTLSTGTGVNVGNLSIRQSIYNKYDEVNVVYKYHYAPVITEMYLAGNVSDQKVVLI